MAFLDEMEKIYFENLNVFFKTWKLRINPEKLQKS